MEFSALLKDLSPYGETSNEQRAKLIGDGNGSSNSLKEYVTGLTIVVLNLNKPESVKAIQERASIK